MKKPIQEINGKKITNYGVAIFNEKQQSEIEIVSFTKKCLALWIKHFINTILKTKAKNKLQDTQFLKLIKCIELLHIEWDYQNQV